VCVYARVCVGGGRGECAGTSLYDSARDFPLVCARSLAERGGGGGGGGREGGGGGGAREGGGRFSQPWAVLSTLGGFSLNWQRERENDTLWERRLNPKP